MSEIGHDETARRALVGDEAEASIRAAVSAVAYAVRRASPVGHVDGIPVGPAVPLDSDTFSSVQRALLSPTTWVWEASTRHRPMADTVVELSGPAGRALVGLDCRGAKLGIVRAGRLHVADLRTGSEGGVALVALAERAARA